MLAMRSSLAALALALAFALPASAQEGEPARTLRFTGEGPYRLTIVNPVGHVTLLPQAPGAGPLLSFTAERVKPRAVSGAERDLVAQARLKSELTSPAEARIETEFGGSGLAPVQIAATIATARFDYVLRVPAGTAVTVRLERGDVRAEAPAGPLDLRTRTGSVRVVSPAEATVVDTEQGDVEVTRPAGPLTVGTHTGRVTITDPRSDVRVRSNTGAVRLTVSPSYAANTRIDTVSGKFYSDLTPFGSDPTPGARGYAGILRGALAPATPPERELSVATIAGDVTLRTDRRLRAAAP